VNEDFMTREVVAPLLAWDAAAHSNALLKAGTLLRGCRVSRHPGKSDPYIVDFEVEGRRLECPLFAFQPRTECPAEANAGEQLAG